MRNRVDEQVQDVTNVLAAQKIRLAALCDDTDDDLGSALDKADDFLALRGVKVEDVGDGVDVEDEPQLVRVSSWSQMVRGSDQVIEGDARLDELLGSDELEGCTQVIHELNESYKCIHRLDKLDIGIAASAAVVSAALDILAVGVPEKTKDGIKEAPLGNFIREQFDQAFPGEEMERLANQMRSKVPYDAQDNRNTAEYVEGLSAYYHRLLSLGHDPFLGLFVGVHDIVTGKMTTIDKAGKLVSQAVAGYADRTEKDIFSAVCKQVLHFMSDASTSMGLPAPLMGLFNTLQVGKFGPDSQTIAEIVQGMYFEGYDFVHFVSQAVPVMVAEVIVRLGWAAKRISEGHSAKDSIPFSIKHAKHPKLGTMLFIAHAGATAVNAGNVYFTKNPLAINYPQWVAFAVYSFKQAKWVLLDKPDQQNKYVLDQIAVETGELLRRSEERLAKGAEGFTIVFG
ncbi:hypothetical protein PZH32_02345 [Adlercreutzia equolifaciens]|uniref:hypothetical protein n=1 Tax=Adlercreutzia equolifaciens TaxID=446660 RepID=UPI0023AF9EBE|nr:hypothetical protein [Adlercreutzia equolifaciens]MDE8701798.1 hypothetical protein [Adlercreutzia equolifaciens]